MFFFEISPFYFRKKLHDVSRVPLPLFEHTGKSFLAHKTRLSREPVNLIFGLFWAFMNCSVRVGSG